MAPGYDGEGRGGDGSKAMLMKVRLPETETCQSRRRQNMAALQARAMELMNAIYDGEHGLYFTR
jgi:hypothetical protein